MNNKLITCIAWGCIITLFLVSSAAVKYMFTAHDPFTTGEKITTIHIDSAVHYQKDNHWHIRAMVAEGNLASLQAYNRTLVDSVLKTLHITGNQLQYITALSMEAKGRVITRVDTGTRDGVHYANISGTDGFLTLSGDLVKNFADYQYSDSLTLAGYWKRRAFWKGGIFGKKDLYADAWFQNPNAKIKYLNALQVKGSKPGRWAVGPTLGFGYNGKGWYPFAGIGVQYSLLRW